MNPDASTGHDTSALTQALALTHAMALAAQAADWDQLQRLESQREPLLHRQHPADQASHALIAEVLASDRRLQVVLAQARDLLTVQWNGESGGIRAISAYQQV